ncbi:MAG TPA: SgcJ/EcaC family oxidoreductase [bacterium]|jgi:uncharacterized protein (TIGR02246 family)|nr:SgcJ/EcaC family oxidoreductase [bacterium]
MEQFNENGSDIAAVTAVIAGIEKATNQSDVEASVSLYTSDGVMMTPHSPAFVGSDAIRKNLVNLFEMFACDITIKVTEVRQVSPDWAYARSIFSGIGTMKSNGQKVPFDYQELRLFRKANGSWKISRNMFTTQKANG